MSHKNRRLSGSAFSRLGCMTALALAASWVTTQAHAAIACTGLSATSASGTTPASGNLDFTGSITVTCSRLTTDALTQVIYIGLGLGENPDGTAGREMTRQTGAQQMNYAVYRNSGFTGAWSEGNGRAPGNATGGGLQPTITFSSAATTSQSFSFPYYARVTQANYGGVAQPAGIYDDLTVGVTVRLTSRTGTVQSTGTIGLTVSKPSSCYISSAPSALALNYDSFRTTALTGNTAFSVSCTASTAYTLALDATSGTIVGLNYTLALSSASSTGTGFAQGFTVNANMIAGQSGICAAATCNGSQARTLTITY